uniref:Synaptotagmin-like protein 1 n=1 Tax=Crocodylus porosus TaxID=8502 RepID=A0A7M4E654_CROPO
MAQDIEADCLLDLSFLTEEEQSTIGEVLLRDSQLRVLEEGRVSKLRKSVSDPSQLKGLTGDWFCDVRAKRHRHNHLGADIVRASIRRKKKPRGRGWGADRLHAGLSPSCAGRQLAGMLTRPPRLAAGASQARAREGGMGQGGETSPSEASHPGLGAGSCRETRFGWRRELVAPPGPSAPHLLPPPTPRWLFPARLQLSGSMMSLYSEGDVGSVEVCGCIQLSLHYEATRKELRVHVVQCRGLAQAKKRRSDPYVKTYLLPDKSNHGKRKTAIKKRSLDPVFNETLKYKMEKDELQSRVLNASVWHHDPLGRNLFLGEVEIALSTWDWGNVHPEWFNLQPRTPVSPHGLGSRGKLNLALKFIPAGAEGAGLPPTGELHIWVKDAQSLIPLRGGTMDSSVQCYVLPDDSKASRQKTRVVKRSLTPLFNHTMVYDGFQAKDLSEACAEFTLWHHENFSKQLLGGLRLSLGTGSSYGLPVPWMDSTEEERRVWGRLLQQPCLWVEALLPLRTNLTPRT